MESINVDQLHQALAADPDTPVVDIREPMEHALGMVPGAIPLPMSQLAARYAELADHKDGIHVICQSGSRSIAVCNFLAQQGYRAINVNGGTGAWSRAGYALATAAR